MPNALGRAASYAELRKLASKAKLGNDLVVQTPYGDSGRTTFFVSSEKDWNKYADSMAKEQLKVMKRINHLPGTIEGAAPRCGACSRAGHACRQPAMQNGRCRFHGGKSTGPRTAAGLANSRAARRTHGGYSAEIIDLRRAAAAHARRVRALAALRSPKVKPEARKRRGQMIGPTEQ